MPKILFVPVSGPYGMGEYARSVAIARAAQRRWQAADVHFVLSRQAPYAGAAPFPATLLDSSPTFHSAAVIDLMESLRPDMVIFDNAGRTAQMRAARRIGARIVYISARARQRRKAFRWRWMRLLDEHWIAYPEFIAGRLDFWERFKLKALQRPVVRYLDVILSNATASQRSAILSRAGYDAGGYALVVPGGGTGHPRARDATEQFLTAASALAQSGVATIFVGPGSAPLPSSKLRCFDSLPQSDLVQLMRDARLVVTNGGSTLLQGIACGAACIAAPIAHDQAQRIQRCVEADVTIAAQLNAADIVQSASRLLADEAARGALAQRAAALGLADGVDIAVSAIARLLETD